MKKSIVMTLFSALAFMCSAESSSVVKVTVENPSSVDKADAPVVLSVSKLLAKTRMKVVSAAVEVAKKQIPSQLDDLNRDGQADELVFLLNLRAHQKQIVTIRVAADSSLYKEFPARTHAQMWRKDKEKKTIVPVSEASSPTGNLYQSLHHHGPAFESEYMAYRLYFDEKQTVDIYGKKKHRLELMDTKWYPTDKQLEEGYGDDILWVKATAGCGTIKGWNGTKATHIAPVTNRTGRILASGPVRSVVEMDAEGWKYEDKEINLNQRYIIYAGHRDVEVEVSMDHPAKLCAGVQTFFDKSDSLRNVPGVVAIWGTGLQYPVTDNPRTKPQTVGMAVSAPLSVVRQSTTDKDNLLLILSGSKFTYHLLAAWEQEEGGFKQSKAFFNYVKEWNKSLQSSLKVNL